MDSDNLFVIVCHGRSGSTLLRRLLNTHSQIFAPTEPWLFFWLIDSLKKGRFGSIAFRHFLGEDEHRSLREFLIGLVETKLKRSNKKIFVEKTPRNNEILTEISELVPEAKYIYLMRDFASIVESALYRYDTWKSVLRKRTTGFVLSHALSVIKKERVIHNFVSGISPEKLFTLSYEDLVSNPTLVLSELFAWMGVTYENVLEYKSEDLVLGDKKSNNSRSIEIRNKKSRLNFLERQILSKMFTPYTKTNAELDKSYVIG